MRYCAWSLLTVAAILFTPLPALAAFWCPAADVTAMGDKPTLSDDDAAASGGTVSATLKSTIRRMQAQGMKGGEIIDSLVVADCSRVDVEPKVSEAGKAEQVRRFASKITHFVYSTPGQSEDDILLNVSVPTPRYEQLRRAAGKAGMSEDVWVNEAIAAKLAKP